MLMCSSLQSIVSADAVSLAPATPIGASPVVLKLPVGFVGGAIGPGNLKPDVENVQKLLNISFEKIGVPALPIAVDGKVGPETIKAINAFQDSQIGYHDSVVQPGKKTITRLNEIAAGGTAFGPMKQSALEAIPTAFSWVVGARMALAGVHSAAIKTGDSQAIQTLNLHFHLNRLTASPEWYLNKIRRVFELTVDVLVNAAHYLQEGPGNGFADAPMGGYHFKNSPAFNHITIRKEFPPCGLNARAAMLVHECAHFVGFLNEITHFAMEFPPPQGKPQGKSNHNYQQLTPDEAVLNASTYAAYAIHAATGVDSRFGLGKPDQ